MYWTRFERARLQVLGSPKDAWTQLLRDRGLAGRDGVFDPERNEALGARMPGFGQGVAYSDALPVCSGFRFSYFGNSGSRMPFVVDEFSDEDMRLTIAQASDDRPGRSTRTYSFWIEGNPDTGNVYRYAELTMTMTTSDWVWGIGFFGRLGLIDGVLGVVEEGPTGPPEEFKFLRAGRYMGWPRRPKHKRW